VAGSGGVKRLLITGASGFLGHALCLGLRNGYEVHGLYRSHRPALEGVAPVRCDLADPSALARVFSELRPEAVIHAAALSGTNYCQDHPDESYAVNVAASGLIAGLCAERTIPLVFTSSDMVFDGLRAPYAEADPVRPVNLYGEHKALAEREVLACHPGAVVARLALLYGPTPPHSGSFLQPMLAAMRSGRDVPLFTDEYRTPLSAADAVQGLGLALLAPLGTVGILHLAGGERLSRHAFGRLVQDAFGLPGARLVPCRQQDLALSAPRPPDLALDIAKARSLGFSPGPVREELARIAQAEKGPLSSP
jgi:dTDP-4-dehydrorhamnose reductase